MMYEMIVPDDNLLIAFEKALKMAEEDGYITTKTVSDILKPVEMSKNFIISELTWWFYEELKGSINTIEESITKPWHSVIIFPKYHTWSTPDREVIKMLKMISDAVKKTIINNGGITAEDLAELFPSLFGDILITGPHFTFSDSEKCMDFICNYLNERNITLPEYDKSKNSDDFDAVSHPSHYTEGLKYEPLNFNLGNAVKYVSRAGRKGDKIEDLLKAIQYIEFEIEESKNRIMRLKKRLNAVYGMNKEDVKHE